MKKHTKTATAGTTSNVVDEYRFSNMSNKVRNILRTPNVKCLEIKKVSSSQSKIACLVLKYAIQSPCVEKVFPSYPFNDIRHLPATG